MKDREELLETLYEQYAWLLDQFGVDSPVASACLGAYAKDAEALNAMGLARIMKSVFGSADPSKWKRSQGAELDPDASPTADDTEMPGR